MTERSRGYTLIELSVVVLLVGLMLTLAFPRVQDTLLNDDLKAVTRRLVGAARELRHNAVREQMDLILRVDLAEGTYWQYPADATPEECDALQRAAVRLPDGVRWLSVRRAGEARRDEGKVDLHFFRQGYATPAVLQLAKGDRVITLVFQPFHRDVLLYGQRFEYVFNEEDRDAAR